MQLSNNKKRKIKDMLAQAKEALAAGRLAPFEGLCRKIERLHPDHPDVANLRAIAFYKTGRPAEAEGLFAAAIKAAPSRHEFHNNLGAMYLDQGRYAEAAKCYGEVIRLGNKTFPVQLCYCNALVESGQFEQALPLLKRLHAQKPRDTSLLMGLFLASDPLRLTEEAEGYLRQIIAIDPEHAEAHAKLGRLALQLGRMDEAEAEARKVLSILPTGSPRAYDILTYAKSYEDADDPDVTAMRELYEQSAPDSGDRQAMSFMLGRVMEQLRQYDRAFAYLAEGNAIHRRHSGYRADEELERMAQTLAAYTPEVLAHTSAVDDASPIFILGMPRCGSSLTEQILAAHPDADSRGECDLFASKALTSLREDHKVLPLARLAALEPEQWAQVGRSYLQHLRGDDAASLRIVDKTLTNFEMIGAIHCALPQAKIVHVRRHPLDTCLSIYKLPLVGHHYGYGYDLDEMGRYYQMYLKLMQHWRHTLPAGAMYELDYESLVANQEEETRKLLDYCGLPWNEACLQFTKAKNIVRTSSMAQVRRDIYADSVAAWKHYEKHLKPLIRILGTKRPDIR